MPFGIVRRLPAPIKAPIIAAVSAALAAVSASRSALASVAAWCTSRIDESKRQARRRALAMSYYREKLALIDSWVPKFTEEANFYYQLTARNRDQLAQLIATVTSESHSRIVGYFDELEGDQDLRTHITELIKGSVRLRDTCVEYGRRIGWYAFVRALKPKAVIETGVDLGVGSCVLASALLRNAAEGFAGRYYGTEILPQGGQLFCGRYAAMGEILYGDSIETLRKFSAPIDLFINDSDHSAQYEYNEYLTIKDKLASGAVILADNAHVTQCLSHFSREVGRKFLYFSEEPADHWYPGAGIGVSFTQEAASRARHKA